MKKAIRRIALLCIVLTLVVGICVPAFATYPKVSLYSRPTTAYRGYYMYHVYILNSYSYPYRDGYRANYDGFISRTSTGTRYAKWDFNFTGKVKHTLKTAVYDTWPKGRYKTQVRTFYRPYATGRWQYVRGFNWFFNVR
jgi:hypothetical protein